MFESVTNIITGETVLIEKPDVVLSQDEINALRKSEILLELSELDLVLPRIAEDLINASGSYDNLPQIVKERYNQKTALRNELKDLI